jgi:hypothetical protein
MSLDKIATYVSSPYHAAMEPMTFIRLLPISIGILPRRK